MDKINIKELAEQLYEEVDAKTNQMLKDLIVEIENSDNSTSKEAILLSGILTISKRHNEDFTIKLLQKAIDELKSSSNG